MYIFRGQSVHIRCGLSLRITFGRLFALAGIRSSATFVYQKKLKAFETKTASSLWWKALRRLQNLNKSPLLINLLAMRTTYETTKSLYCLRTFIIAECHAACEKHQGNFREANWKFSNRVYIWRPYIFWSLLSAQNWIPQNLAYSVFQRFFKEFTSANVAWSAITTKHWLADSRKDISKMIS